MARTELVNKYLAGEDIVPDPSEKIREFGIKIEGTDF